MYEIVMPKEIDNALSRESHYLLLQTMRITNQVKTFHVLIYDVVGHLPKTTVTLKKIGELLFQHAANLYEVMHSVFDSTAGPSLYDRYLQELKNPDTLKSLKELKDLYAPENKAVRVLEAIRNKHSAHIATDSFYAWQSITDSPADQDIIIGVADTEREADWYFTVDLGQIYNYIQKNIFQGSEDTQEAIKQIISQYSAFLLILFGKIGEELFKGKLIMREVPDEW